MQCHLHWKKLLPKSEQIVGGRQNFVDQLLHLIQAKDSEKCVLRLGEGFVAFAQTQGHHNEERIPGLTIQLSKMTVSGS